MKTVNGIYTSAKIFTDDIENYALAQIQMLCDMEAFANCKIRIMPDVHPGKVGTIGFTSTVGDKILPSVVGIDIGCGITAAKIKQKKAEFQKLDTVIRENIPSGFGVRKSLHRFMAEVDLDALKCGSHIQRERIGRSLGTLGGGNHFIELDRGEDSSLFAVIHSGSRNLGKEVTEYYLDQGQKYLKEQGVSVPYELTWLDRSLMEDYLQDMQVVLQFAEWNRRAILDELAKGMKWKVQEIHSVMHNYVDCEERILRKGAVSAKKGEWVAIPVNMRDGVLIGTGLGNADWNDSAPHGAGRILKREDVKKQYTVSSFKKEMKGIYSSCISQATLDEALFAYRGLEQIAQAVSETVAIEERLTPVYNYKDQSR